MYYDRWSTQWSPSSSDICTCCVKYSYYDMIRSVNIMLHEKVKHEMLCDTISWPGLCVKMSCWPFVNNRLYEDLDSDIICFMLWFIPAHVGDNYSKRGPKCGIVWLVTNKIKLKESGIDGEKLRRSMQQSNWRLYCLTTTKGPKWHSSLVSVSTIPFT